MDQTPGFVSSFIAIIIKKTHCSYLHPTKGLVCEQCVSERSHLASLSHSFVFQDLFNKKTSENWSAGGGKIKRGGKKASKTDFLALNRSVNSGTERHNIN